MNHIPWIEKYRPRRFEDIVLDKTNNNILTSIVDKNYFPNLLFYGPPGTGKTTTIINLIKKYEDVYKQKNKGFVIHLNASDDRGIDIIRNQIYQFVNTKGLFGDGTKFVILDEADYMTKNAQNALRHLIQKYSDNVRYCLICNYISRIDPPLQNEFVKLRFSKLPELEIMSYLKDINTKEKLSIPNKNIISIQKSFNSDIRSMVNYMQSNKNRCVSDDIYIADSKTWDEILSILVNRTQDYTENFIKNMSIKYNEELKVFLKNFIYYLISMEPFISSDKFIRFFKYILHNYDADEKYMIKYFVHRFTELYKAL